jgi:hypothetical protein
VHDLPVRLELGARPLPQHPDQHRSKRPILLAVDQQLREGAALRRDRVLADSLRALEVGQHKDVEQFDPFALGAPSLPLVAEKGSPLDD